MGCTGCQDCVAACPVKDCLRLVGPGRLALRPAHGVLLAVGVYFAITLGFRLHGHWQGVVSEGEYARRLSQISSPLYSHGMGTAPVEEDLPGVLAPSH